MVGAGLDQRKLHPPPWDLRQRELHRCLSATIATIATIAATASAIGSAIGPAMAVALLTTLYGAMIANMFALPVADKVGIRAEEEARIQSMIIDALLAIQAGQNPRVIQGLLKTYLPASKRASEGEE